MNLVRLLFLLLLIAVVLLFILAKSGGSGDEQAEDDSAIQAEIAEGEFGKGWTDLKYKVEYRWASGKLQYDLLIYPYDARVEKLRSKGMELVLLSFMDEERNRIVPQKAPVRIEMRDLEVVIGEVEGQRVAQGWRYTAEINKEDASGTAIADAEMGWLFSNDLLALLRNLRKERLLRDAKVREARPVGSRG
jgi:hypothetical protein